LITCRNEHVADNSGVTEGPPSEIVRPLAAGGQFVSPSVIGLKPIKVGKTVGNIDANHEASPAVTSGHQNENGGEGGIRTPGTV